MEAAGDESSSDDQILTSRARKQKEAAGASHSPAAAEVESMDDETDDDMIPTRRRATPPPKAKPAVRGKAGVIETSSEEEDGSDEEASESDYTSDSDSDYEDSDDSSYVNPRLKQRTQASKMDAPTAARPKVLAEIVGHRDDPTGDYDYEYLIKYTEYSYRELEWKVEPEIHAMWTGSGGYHKKLGSYQAKMMDTERVPRIKKPKTPQKPAPEDAPLSSQQHRYAEEALQEQFFDPAFKTPERIVTSGKDPKRQLHYLVKWEGLGYDLCTWEPAATFTADADLECIKRYNKFSLAPANKVNFERPSMVPTLGVLHKAVCHRSQVLGVYGNGNRLRDYQEEGVAWLLRNWFGKTNCILGDEMGLGKTVQVLSFCDAMRDLRSIPGPFLIIAPLATIGHWTREASQWMPNMNAVCYLGNERARDRAYMHEFYYKSPASPLSRGSGPVKFHVLVTTYEWVVRDIHRLNPIHWAGIIIDEGHRMKNEEAALFKALVPVKTEFRCVLTGTPVQNHIGELYAILKYLDKKTVDRTQEKFLERMSPMTQETMDELFEVLGPRLLRREKGTVEKSIPPKIEILVKVALTKHQREVYKEMIESHGKFLKGDEIEKGKKGTKKQRATRSQNLCMELRKICNHPWLIEGGEARTLEGLGYGEGRKAPDSVVFEAMVRSSAKMMFLEKLLAKFRAEGEKVLIFSQFVTVLHVIHDFLTWKGYPFETISGETAGHLRQRAVDRFMSKDYDSFVFMISTKAGGCGINLTAASKVVIFDSDWNPQNDLQAQARCHRIGQKREVEVYRVLTENTYEERMFEVASQKLGLDHVILHSAAQTKGQSPANTAMGLSSEEIERVLKHGAYDLYKDKGADVDAQREAEGIDAILERSKKIVHGVNEAAANEADDASPAEGHAVRGLAAFSKVNFKVEDEALDDPDFWAKLLPEEVNVSNLAKKINGSAQPSTPEEVAAFVSDLEKAVKQEVADLGPGLCLITTAALNKQQAMEALCVQVQGLPQFQAAGESISSRIGDALNMAIEPRLRTRQRRKRGVLEDENPVGYLADVRAATRASLKDAETANAATTMRRARQQVLQPWAPDRLAHFVKAVRKYGYGRWDACVEELREVGAYPVVDFLTAATRETRLASVFEGLVSFLATLPDASFVKKDPASSKKKKPAKKKAKKRSDSSDDYEDSGSEASESSSASSSSSVSCDNGVARIKGYHPTATGADASRLGKVEGVSRRVSLQKMLAPFLDAAGDFCLGQAAARVAAAGLAVTDAAIAVTVQQGWVDPATLEVVYGDVQTGGAVSGGSVAAAAGSPVRIQPLFDVPAEQEAPEGGDVPMEKPTAPRALVLVTYQARVFRSAIVAADVAGGAVELVLPGILPMSADISAPTGVAPAPVEYGIVCVQLDAAAGATVAAAAAAVARAVQEGARTPIAATAPQPYYQHIKEADLSAVAVYLAGNPPVPWETMAMWNEYLAVLPQAAEEGMIDPAAVPEDVKRVVDTAHANGGVIQEPKQAPPGARSMSASPVPVAPAPKEYYSELFRDTVRAWKVNGAPLWRLRHTHLLSKWRQELLASGVRPYLAAAGVIPAAEAWAQSKACEVKTDPESRKLYRLVLKRVQAFGLGVKAVGASVGAPAPESAGDGPAPPYPPQGPLEYNFDDLTRARGFPETPQLAELLRTVPDLLADAAAAPEALRQFAGAKTMDEAAEMFKKSKVVCGGLQALFALVQKDCGTLVPGGDAATDPLKHLKMKGLLRTLASQINKHHGSEKKKGFWPDWWDMACDYDLCRGIAAHAVSQGDILWDPDLPTFYKRVAAKATDAEKETAETPGKEKPNVVLFPHFQKKLSVTLTILERILSGTVPLKVLISSADKMKKTAAADKAEFEKKAAALKAAEEKRAKAKAAAEEKKKAAEKAKAEKKAQKEEEKKKKAEEAKEKRAKAAAEKKKKEEEKKKSASKPKPKSKPKAKAQDKPEESNVPVDVDALILSQETVIAGPAKKRGAGEAGAAQDSPAKRAKTDDAAPAAGEKRRATDVDEDAAADGINGKRLKPEVPAPIAPPKKLAPIKEKKQASLTAFFGAKKKEPTASTSPAAPPGDAPRKELVLEDDPMLGTPLSEDEGTPKQCPAAASAPAQ
eukprot:TRINITY_DN9102_c0_g1_i3.p1 TRINITY_DN9102_c0_g1~~TRINITY_DN9102_c0_g1_i3.p1  ORF type:complete len:2162 (+),score=837.19 TRINITY_DN9102_c0_g1_i3:126-6488(+)